MPVMKKSAQSKALAKRNKMKTGDAADQMNRAVTQIILTLRSGQSARLPGVGTLDPGRTWTFRADTEKPNGETS